MKHSTGSYKAIASRCKIPDREDQGRDLLQLTKDWLERFHTRDFLFIVDEVDNRLAYFGNEDQQGTPLHEYIPRCPCGSLLYITCSRDLAFDLDPERQPIEVPSMSADEAQSLLGKCIRAQSSDAEQVQLLEELVCSPLAISQAIVFMTKSRKTIPQYLSLLCDTNVARSRFLERVSGPYGKENSVLYAVVRTCWVAFSSVSRDNRRATELLSVISFFERYRIPDGLLKREEENETLFEGALELLEAYALITREHRPEEPAFDLGGLRHSLGWTSTMHRLIHIATKLRVTEDSKQSDYAASEPLTILSHRFPYGWFQIGPFVRISYRMLKLCYIITLTATIEMYRGQEPSS